MSAAPKDDELIERREGVITQLNLMVTCGCCDDEWPHLRQISVAMLRDQASRIAELRAESQRRFEILKRVHDSLRLTPEIAAEVRRALSNPPSEQPK